MKAISFSQALELLQTPDEETFSLLAQANQIRQKYKGNKVRLCAIINARSGSCSENCIFCAQSAHYKTKVDEYPLLDPAEILESAKSAQNNMQAGCFSIVTSGKSVSRDAEIDKICQSLSALAKETRVNRCASLGTLTLKQAKRLKAAGLNKFHHNLEAAESYFDKICTTHKFSERLQTVKNAKAAGLEVCCGGIFGVGESLGQRVELAFAIKELEVQTVPLNFLNPVAGTPAAENYKPISPLEALRLIAVFRLILPDKDIGVFGGREFVLKELQPLLFMAGANVILVGNYLTTLGQSPQRDLQMIQDLGLKVEESKN